MWSASGAASVQNSAAEDVCVVLDQFQSWCILSAPAWLCESAKAGFQESRIPNHHGKTPALQQAVLRCCIPHLPPCAARPSFCHCHATALTCSKTPLCCATPRHAAQRYPSLMHAVDPHSGQARLHPLQHHSAFPPVTPMCPPPALQHRWRRHAGLPSTARRCSGC